MGRGRRSIATTTHKLSTFSMNRRRSRRPIENNLLSIFKHSRTYSRQRLRISLAQYATSYKKMPKRTTWSKKSKCNNQSKKLLILKVCKTLLQTRAHADKLLTPPPVSLLSNNLRSKNTAATSKRTSTKSCQQSATISTCLRTTQTSWKHCGSNYSDMWT